MSPDEVGRIVLRGLEDERFLIVTHPMARAAITDRNDAILDEFDLWEPLIQALGISTRLTPVP